MKKSYQFFAVIVLVVLVLFVVLLTAQINSARSIERLVAGNRQAETTFLVNNRLEKIVNLSFEVESIIMSAKPPYAFDSRPGIADSLHQLIDNADRLKKLVPEAPMSSSLDGVVNLVKRQAELSFSAISRGGNLVMLDSLRKNHFGDSIYLNALAFQVKMESTLKETLFENNQVAAKVSVLNKLLAITALVAILLLGTIVIRRQVTQLLLIRDLEKARKLALQSAQVKDQFLANMSHEIRTPLNAVKGFSTLLSKTDLNEEQLQYAGIINSSSESLLHIVNDILDLSKMEAGSWTIQNKPFRLSLLLKELELTYANIAYEKKLAFMVTADDTLEDHLVGDPERLKQVLMNLISNAIKFTKEGSVHLALRLLERTKDYQSVHFEVSDTGIGIPEDKIDIVFERFEQVDNAFIRQQGGAGLGLAITKMIIESMGSDIQVESASGKGSRFSFTLQFALNLEGMAEQGARPIWPNQVVTDPTRKKILLAEDNRVNQLLIEKYLEPFRLRPVVVHNGRDALKMLELEHFDVVLMDVQMPEMDGITTTRHIRTSSFKEVPVIGLTAYVQPSEIEKCYAAGMNEYIPKPIDERQFLNVLQKYIYLEGPAIESLSPVPRSFPDNFAFLEKICNGNVATIQLIITTMAAELPKDRDQFSVALDSNNREAVGPVLHHMRSTISPLGNQSKVAKSLEHLSQLLLPEYAWPVIKAAGEQLLEDLQETITFLKNNKFA